MPGVAARKSPWKPILEALSGWDSDAARLRAFAAAVGCSPPEPSRRPRPSLRRDLARAFNPLLDARSAADLLMGPGPLPRARRLALLERFAAIDGTGLCLHHPHEILPFLTEILALGPDVPGVIVEAGVARGGGTAKISAAASAVKRAVLACDGFRGLPASAPETLVASKRRFHWRAGQYRAGLAQARRSVALWGEPSACRFVAGLFEDTLPSLTSPVAAAFIDVDLVSSTKTCLRALYPLLSPGGALYSQDAKFAGVARLLEDDRFWEREVGAARPLLERLSPSLARLRKPRAP